MFSASGWKKLAPFGFGKPDYEVWAEISFSDLQLVADYKITGNFDLIKVPSLKQNPERLDELSLSTCFEIFLSPENNNKYWEWNFSPAGDWAFYSFDSERTGRTQDERIQQVKTECIETSRWRFSCSIQLLQDVFRKQNLQIGLTSVIATKDNQKTYWALHHSEVRPDFHKRESFILRCDEGKFL